MREPPYRLQGLTFPNFDVCSEEGLYLRLTGFTFFDMKRRQVDFLAGGTASSDTFYNGLTVGVWKRLCDIRELVLTLEGEGSFVVSFGIHQIGQASCWLDEQAVELAPGRPAEVPVVAWPRVRDGLLFFRLRATRPGLLSGGGFATPQPAPNDVRLGLVITHFNRQAQVLPAIERIRSGLLAQPAYSGRITLTVVDNSRNLPLPAAQPGIRCIANRNLGGTGGFVRGLLSVIDGGQHTHALFMDDDASCETESIARTHALLSHCRDGRLSVAGALLRELAPWQLIEKGARFDGQVRPLGAGLDMRQVGDLLAAERLATQPDYGAWWFFAFPLAEVRRLPFPFFVRGDDIQFGLANRFHIATLNGVACFGEDFSAKHSPLTAYLDARYHLVLALIGGNAGGPAALEHAGQPGPPAPPAAGGHRPDGRRNDSTATAASRIFWVASRLFLKPLTAYQYSSARAVTLALQHVLAGPRFFADNLDLQSVRNQIAGWAPNEKPLPLDRAALGALRGVRRGRESKGRRLVRLLTLQGFLLPTALLKNRTTVQDKDFHGSASQVFRYRRVLYEHAQSGTGWVAEYDRPRFFAELWSFLRSWAALLCRLPALRRSYAGGAAELTSPAFWRGVYATESTSVEPAAAADPGGQRGPAPIT